MSRLRIARLSPGASIQDGGRIGYRRFGVTQGGAMDPFALAEGQALLSNSHDAAALEMTMNGGRFQCEGSLSVACTGAEMSVSVNGHFRPWRQVIQLQDGDELELGSSIDGIYSYLHLASGIESQRVLGSRSAHEQADLGRVPQAGEWLDSVKQGIRAKGLTLPRPEYFSERVIRIMKGAQSHLFSDDDFCVLTESEFRVTSERNRVGIRLASSAGAFNAELGTTLASDAIVPGDIQVAADGVAAVLLADSQPIGGYPRIATVISTDLHKLAQMQTGTVFRMELVGRDEAVAALKQYRIRVAELKRKLVPAVRNPSEIKDLLAYSLIAGVVKGDEQDGD